MMSISLLQPSFFMSKTRSYAKMEWKRSRFFLTAMAIHCCLRVAPLDLQQGGNSRIPYVHVPAARMSIVVYIATAINTFFFLLTKHPFFFALPDFVYYRNGCFFDVLDLSYWGVSGKTYVGHLLGVGCSFNLSMNLVPYLPGCTAFSKASCRTGFNPCWTDIPIIKSSVNWWNTSHQPGSISRSGTSIHVPMLIPILSNLTNFLFSTPIFFVLETRLPIPEFLESPLTEEIEAREGIPKPSSLAESLHPWLNG